jgi:hypothetical protein
MGSPLLHSDMLEKRDKTEVEYLLHALGKKDVKPMDILRSKYTNIDRAKWIPWTTPELQ